MSAISTKNNPSFSARQCHLDESAEMTLAEATLAAMATEEVDGTIGGEVRVYGTPVGRSRSAKSKFLARQQCCQGVELK